MKVVFIILLKKKIKSPGLKSFEDDKTEIAIQGFSIILFNIFGGAKRHHQFGCSYVRKHELSNISNEIGAC